MPEPAAPAVAVEPFGRRVILLRLFRGCEVPGITGMLEQVLDGVAREPRALVVDASPLSGLDQGWARELAGALRGLPEELRAAALVKPVDRAAAAELTDALDGTLPFFATRAGALLRALVASGALR